MATVCFPDLCLQAKEVQRWGGYSLNLLHYEDAARLAMSVSVH